jgi:hypothetical protein
LPVWLGERRKIIGETDRTKVGPNGSLFRCERA